MSHTAAAPELAKPRRNAGRSRLTHRFVEVNGVDAQKLVVDHSLDETERLPAEQAQTEVARHGGATRPSRQTWTASHDPIATKHQVPR
jgi:hypothetical protein